MIRRHLLSALALIGVVAFISTAFAKHQHQDGQQLLGNKINTTGKHDAHKVGEDTVSIHVENKNRQSNGGASHQRVTWRKEIQNFKEDGSGVRA